MSTYVMDNFPGYLSLIFFSTILLFSTYKRSKWIFCYKKDVHCERWEFVSMYFKKKKF